MTGTNLVFIYFIYYSFTSHNTITITTRRYGSVHFGVVFVNKLSVWRNSKKVTESLLRV